MNTYFNYIVPIFNKEDVLPRTLEGIEMCAGPNSKIFLIVDGCTDSSEDIVDNFIRRTQKFARKINMPNVHMLLSVNAGLQMVTGGFTVILQDDIILLDRDMERKIVELYSKVEHLGIISFRYGSDIRKTSLLETFLSTKSCKPMIKEYNFIKGPDDYANYPQGEYEKFYPKMNAINGPNVIPWDLLSKVKSFDSNLAPYGYDDPEMCLRAIKLGYINGLFPLKYSSEEEWGGTRRSKSFIKEAMGIHVRNRRYVWNKHKDILKKLSK